MVRHRLRRRQLPRRERRQDLLPGPPDPPGAAAPLKANPDGSFDIAVQYSDPNPDAGPEHPSPNWLPIPRRGEFSLTLRQYVPQTDPIWTPPTLTPLTPSSGE
ncbi:DUF1214 domain-containing protein [Kitasatospora sp. NPDC087861]|uniref:DUF1214 domain-containing protein n=1 Tax=Kitasatospora sp. NPDC087861 TaxID=3364070 RepID=UPI00382EA4EB